ncbi:MAG: YciI family protein [Acidobacteriota bacterium]
MKYAILIYETAAQLNRRKTDDADAKAYWDSWNEYSQALIDGGVMAGGAGLQEPHTGTTIRFASGREVHDGPYADTKEQLGGFYLIDVPDLDTALEWAARCPAIGGAVEVRPEIA